TLFRQVPSLAYSPGTTSRSSWLRGARSTLRNMAGPTASPQPSGSTGGINRARLTQIIVAAVVLIYAIIFIALNRSRVRIHFLFFRVTSRLWVALLVCLVLGAVLGQVLGRYRRKQSGKASRSGTPDRSKYPLALPVRAVLARRILGD